MADRAGHKRANRTARDLGLIVCTLTFLALRHYNQAIIVYGGALIGLVVLSGILDPDADINLVSGAETELLEHSWLLGRLFILWSWGYATLMPHRSFWSHFPIISTAIRCVYFVGPAMWTLNYRVDLYTCLWLWIGIFIGLCFTDIGHWLADGRPA